MPGITRETADTCAGTVLTPLQETVFVEGYLAAVLGTPIESHLPCPDPISHCAAVMSECSETVFAESIGICRAGDACDCGHTATGSETVFAN